jgi:transcriptional regulator of met regulon
MDNGLGNQGSRRGNTHSERLAKARSGAFAGRKYPQDASLKPGRNPITNAGQGTNVVKKTPLDPKAPVGDPWKRPDYQKPGAF